MIADALYLIQQELDNYIVARTGDTDAVLMEHIAGAEVDFDKFDSNKIIISLVNVEEESAFKNIETFRRNSFTNSIEYVHPPIHLNLYVLFSSFLPKMDINPERYRDALDYLSLVIQFFQHRKSFSIASAPNSDLADMAGTPTYDNFKVFFDLYTLTFEQNNHLWGSLGGKQYPFVMYKARLVQVQENQVEQGGGLITEIKGSGTTLVNP